MGVVIDEVIADVQPEPQPSESQTTSLSARQPRVDVAAELRRVAARAARIHAD
jgi:hypothetical protein